MTDFFRFPHTPHVAWLGDVPPRDDKILEPDRVRDLLSGEVVVEEKVDGANLGFSTDEAGELLVQNRGSFLTHEVTRGQFGPLRAWLEPRRDRLTEALWPDLMLFGEWCVAVHSVRYDRLPDWFLGFDIYDRRTECFWDSTRRDALLEELDLCPVPRLAKGRTDLEELHHLPQLSRLGSEPMEGLVLRQEAAGFTRARAKLVFRAFIQAITGHWSRGPMRKNMLAR